MDPTVRLVAVLWLLFMFSKLSFAAQLARQDREQRNVEWEQPNLFLSRFWHVLGPFQIGTQEAAWGADPLEEQGGFGALKYHPEATFPSALGDGGLCRWAAVPAIESVAVHGRAKAALRIGFPEINWSFMRSIYGWSALQYQAWARGNLTVHDTAAVTALVYADGILEFRVDGALYFGGDFYSYRRAPLILDLNPGVHTIDIRFVYDIRARGGSDNPQIDSLIEFHQVPQQLIVDPASVLTADVVDGRLAGPYASLSLANAMKDDVEVIWIKPADASTTVSLPGLTIINSPLRIVSHQTRPLAFELRFSGEVPTQIRLSIGYTTSSHDFVQAVEVVINLKHRSILEAQKFTFLHPSGTVSHALLRPPLNNTCRTSDERGFPLLLGLHGAGVELDGDLAQHMFDGVYGICAWIIIPSGVTSWSGDDWHTWGFADVKAAISAIPNWMDALNWRGQQAALDDWVVVGHSNGGQGTWYVLSHQPDNVLAAAPVSGYSSIENYVPFNLWQNAEASLAAVLEAARSNFKHELLTTNFVGIPILQQHGAEDDNVPAYHSRLMHQLIWEHGQLTQYHEILGAGHWFDGVLTTAPLQEFYNSHVRRSSSRELLKHFSITFPSSADMGSKGGILVDQLWSPDRFGRIDVDCDLKSRLWRLKTRNVRRFHITVGRVQCFHPKKIIVDGSELPFTASFDETNLTWYTQDLTRNWTVSQNGDWRSLSERYGRQVGTLDSILRTKGPLTVMSHSLESNRIASQISRSLFQYFAADINLVIAASAALNKSHVISAGSGNVITVTLGGQLSQSELSEFPIFVHGDYLKIRSPGGFPTVQYEFEPGLGAIFLRPLMDERLELVIWGADVEGLQQAARLVPTVTGVGQPDFVVLSARCRWKGANGAYAAGFLDYSWQVSSGSYLS